MNDSRIISPFHAAGKHVVDKTASHWNVCWCGAQKHECVDCAESAKINAMNKVNIGSGEDADTYR